MLRPNNIQFTRELRKRGIISWLSHPFVVKSCPCQHSPSFFQKIGLQADVDECRRITFHGLRLIYLTADSGLSCSWLIKALKIYPIAVENRHSLIPTILLPAKPDPSLTPDSRSRRSWAMIRDLRQSVPTPPKPRPNIELGIGGWRLEGGGGGEEARHFIPGWIWAFTSFWWREKMGVYVSETSSPKLARVDKLVSQPERWQKRR